MKVRTIAHRIQDRVLASFGRAPSDRAGLVQAMLIPKQGDATGYWLQLGIATMLATLGLALNSTAVVIGAMLIAPLMKPLVDLAMGLATGSPALALRATIRTLVSIAVVVVVAVAITWLLPFHSITPELEARTAPSLLDLAVAAACALAAAYATLRADADIATTAAGTSIGISLVPPLCACGYGIALGDPDVARGAALLFTANLSGILAIAAVMFVGAGFARVDMRQEEQTFDALDKKHASIRVGRAISKVTTKRLGPFARIVPPLVLVAMVFIPLERAVGEIKHRSEISQAVSDIVDSDKRRVVQYTLDQTAKAVILRVVVVGDAHTASELETVLRQRLAGLGVDDPKLSVWAVPDAASVSALTRRIDEMPPPSTPEPVAQTVHRYTSDLADDIRAVWPKESGKLVRVALDLDHPDQIRITHLGAPLGAPALRLLAAAIEPHAGAVSITEDALASVEAEPTDGVRWLPAALDLVARARRSGVPSCITVPALPGAPRGRTAKPPDPSAVFVRTIVAALVAGDPTVTESEGERWRATSGPACAAARPAP